LLPRPATRERGEGHPNILLQQLIRPINPGAKAVLKPPQSTRWRDGQGASAFAKRLECGAFTAALESKTVSRCALAPWRRGVRKMTYENAA